MTKHLHETTLDSLPPYTGTKKRAYYYAGRDTDRRVLAMAANEWTARKAAVRLLGTMDNVRLLKIVPYTPGEGWRGKRYDGRRAR